MALFMGIDGGGSNLRVVIVNEQLGIVSESHHASANPNVVGRQEAAYRVQYTMRDAMARARLAPRDLRAVGIGIAGASAHHSDDWLRAIVTGVVPHAHIATSSDMEIALVGAHGERLGLLLLAGTGSVVYGVSASGQTVQIGGWGYILGDEGSGYWLGLQALRHLVQKADGRATQSVMFSRIMQELAVVNPSELLLWLYNTTTPRTREIAALAPLVLQAATENDPLALRFVAQAAHELVRMVKIARQQLNLQDPQIAFAGSLLHDWNPLSRRVCALLNLTTLPIPRYESVIGAALLAKLQAGE